MELTNETYFSAENERRYMGSTQVKSFMACEARTMAQLAGEWEQPRTEAQLVGSYVDAYFEGTLEAFRAATPELFTGTGELKSPYQQAQAIIARIERDELFMHMMAGRKQEIRTGEIDGIPFKIKMDSYHPGVRIVDLKVMRDFEPVYVPQKGRLNFIEAWGYDIQGAIYQAVEGNGLPFVIAAATKEREPDIGIWQVEQAELDVCMELLRDKLQRYALLKIGIGEPERCEKCDYCKRTRKLDKIKSSEELNI